MPTTRTYELDDLISAELHGIDETRQAYFTDEDFEMTLELTNESDKHLTGEVAWVSNTEGTVGKGTPPLDRVDIDVDLSPGETHHHPMNALGITTGSGTGLVVGMRSPNIVETRDDEVVIEPGDRILPMGSIIFWDREFYRVNYLRPRRAQYIAAMFGLLSAVFAGIVIVLMM